MPHSPAQQALMAERLRRGRRCAPAASPSGAGGASLVELAPPEAGAPLFLVHAVAGTVHGYLPLARALAGTYRVCGIAAAAGDDGPAGSLEELAARYLELVRAQQPKGPYAVGGWSTGGLVAFQMAQLLEGQGETVRLVLLDTPFRTPFERGSELDLAVEFVRDAAHSAGLGAVGAADLGGAGVDELLDRLAARLGGGSEASALKEELQRRFATFRTNRLMLVGYVPRGTLGGDASLVWAADSPNHLHLPGWPSVLHGRVSTATLACDHYALVQPPAVDDVAAAVAGAA